MRWVTAWGIVLAAAFASAAFGNPRPCYDIVHVRAFPPEIGITCECNDSTDLSGDTIFTSAGIAIVDSGVFVNHRGLFDEPFILDSANSSGFIINPEADSVSMHITNGFWGWHWIYRVCWGYWQSNSVPNKGNAIRHDWYYSAPMWHFELLDFDFARPRQGFTDVIISEVNSHGDWTPLSNFIELYNKSTHEIDLAGWKIICDTTFEIPVGARLTPHGFYILDESRFPAIFDLDFAADNIYLINADSGTVDQVGWSSDHGANVSFMRYPDGDADSTDSMWDFWGFNDITSVSFENGFPSRGAANRFQSPGLKVIGARADTSGGLADIFWTNPVWIPEFDRALLRKSVSDYPASPTDGQLVYEGPAQEFLGDPAAPGQTTYYTVFARTSDGTYSVADDESRASIYIPYTGLDDGPLPHEALLLACFPNPFNAATTITVAGGGEAEIDIYDIAGRRVSTLHTVDGRVVWKADGMSSGVYFARAMGGGAATSIKLIYLK
jgi:hypothetical protein